MKEKIWTELIRELESKVIIINIRGGRTNEKIN